MKGYCPNGDGHCFVHGYGPEPRKPNYKVVATDYDTYTVVYSCNYFGSALWLMTRESVVDDALVSQMLQIAKENLPNFNFDNMNDRTYHGDKCTYADEA